MKSSTSINVMSSIDFAENVAKTKDQEQNLYEDFNEMSSNIVLNDIYEKFKQDSLYNIPLHDERFNIDNEERVILESLDDASILISTSTRCITPDSTVFGTAECAENEMPLEIALLELRDALLLGDMCFSERSLLEKNDTSKGLSEENAFVRPKNELEHCAADSKFPGEQRRKIRGKTLKKKQKCLTKYSWKSDGTHRRSAS